MDEERLGYSFPLATNSIHSVCVGLDGHTVIKLKNMSTIQLPSKTEMKISDGVMMEIFIEDE